MIAKIAKISLFIKMIIFSIIGSFLIIAVNYMYVSVPERFEGYSILISTNIVGLFFLGMSYANYYLYKKYKKPKLPK